ncbi:UNVERIFIED_ORG: carboxylesterase type B [Nocardia globerula]|uniref:Carboxylic ester hydrolase n=1 Tax=Nocardia globerula TaxID=1818 RepID=A0A652YPX8_NOCGL|nr:carboxylesterase family protein [Rhodococcus globerulus]NMD62599.1 carboxylesterase/lipase family protein [Nocardia globerula]PVX68049.1 carboxylesterase type B [Rhodococcus globerulus]
MSEIIASAAAGKFRGIRRDGSLYFGAIRYATAARFQRPEPAASHTGILDATMPGTVFPQPPSRLERVMGAPHPEPEQSEDSFTVTVTTPSLSGSRPVMVWLHGGGYSSGGGSLAWYDGGALSAEGDVVVVSVNYRVGVLGYLLLEGVSEGNLGVHDQIAALEWVRENIAGFGGDPNSITVFGQSAGAHSIVNLLNSNNSRPLFHRAILQSTPRLDLNLTRTAAIENGETFARLLDGDPNTAPLPLILDAFRATAVEFGRRSENVVQPPFAPISDVAPLTGSADSGVTEVVIGYTHDEGSAFVRGLPGGSMADETTLTQNMFAETVAELADTFTQAGTSVYTYRFDWTPPENIFGATHCIELPFILGTEKSWHGSPMLGIADWTTVDEMGRRIRTLWTSFAHNGSPDNENTWKKFSPDEPIGITFT